MCTRIGRYMQGFWFDTSILFLQTAHCTDPRFDTLIYFYRPTALLYKLGRLAIQPIMHTAQTHYYSPKSEKPKCPKAQNYFGIPDLSRNPETILGFPKIWFGIGLEIGNPENFGLGIRTRVSVRYPILNYP